MTFPASGTWYVLFNSDSTNYAPDYAGEGSRLVGLGLGGQPRGPLSGPLQRADPLSGAAVVPGQRSGRAPDEQGWPTAWIRIRVRTGAATRTTTPMTTWPSIVTAPIPRPGTPRSPRTPGWRSRVISTAGTPPPTAWRWWRITPGN